MTVAPQEPNPSQLYLRATESLHVGLAQEVVEEYRLQLPAPLHVPSAPHGGVGVQRPFGSSLPFGTQSHLPFWPEAVLMPAQLWHLLVQA